MEVRETEARETEAMAVVAQAPVMQAVAFPAAGWVVEVRGAALLAAVATALAGLGVAGEVEMGPAVMVVEVVEVAVLALLAVEARGAAM